MDIKQQIAANEIRLFNTIKSHDIEILDDLLHVNLLFNIPSGETITKAMDMEEHRVGNMIIILYFILVIL